MDRSFKAQLFMDIAISFGGLAILSFLSFYFVGLIEARVAGIQKIRQELSVRRSAIQSLAALRVDAERARSYSSLLENVLPPKDALVRFPRDMEDLAKRNNVEFGSAFGAEVSPTESFPGFINFTFTLGGTYSRLSEFLKAAESGKYILDWNLLDLTLREGAYRGTITGRVFYR
jgi:hypothetical protein